MTKSLICGISALTLASGAAFGGSMQTQSVEAGGPEVLSGWELPVHQPEPFSFPGSVSESASSLESDSYVEQLAGEPRLEPGVIYVYPAEVTEYYLLVPSTDSEMPRG